MTDSLFSILQDTFHTLQNAQSEADVRQAFLVEMPLEHLGTDYLHENLLIEFKHDENMSEPNGMCSIFLIGKMSSDTTLSKESLATLVLLSSNAQAYSSKN